MADQERRTLGRARAARPGLSAHMVLVLAVCFASAPAGAGDDAGVALFIQGDTVKLRAAPNTSAESVGKVLIATPCALVSKAGDWVELRCGELVGFTKLSLVGASAPSREALLADAREAGKSPADRLNAASRASHLAPLDPALDQLLAERFMAAEWALLEKTLKRSAHTSWGRGTCVEGDPAERCVARALEGVSDGAWHRLEVRDGKFVSAMKRGAQLQVIAGTYSGRRRGRAGNSENDYLVVTAWSRVQYEPSEVLLRALAEGAATKLAVNESHLVGAPTLSAKAASLLRRVPGDGCPEVEGLFHRVEGDVYDRFELYVRHEQEATISAITEVVENPDGFLELSTQEAIVRCRRE